jgi:calcineurin-like phosphoesterase family protein
MVSMNTFFTADTHFGHERIMRYCNRPFANVHEMDETMVERWNAKVGVKDLVYHLGDFAFLSAGFGRKIRNRLNGRICLIEGNHDGPDFGFAWRKSYYELKMGDQYLVLFHYGMRTWWHDLRGVWHLYGHSHGGLAPYGKSFDIGVDCWNFAPLSFEEVKVEMDKREIGKHPQFEKFQKEG